MVACATVSRTVGSVSGVFSAFFGAVETTVRLLFGCGACRGRRGSTAWSSQVPRSQACSGSSTIFQARSAPGPAITLR